MHNSKELSDQKFSEICAKMDSLHPVSEFDEAYENWLKNNPSFNFDSYYSNKEETIKEFESILSDYRKKLYLAFIKIMNLPENEESLSSYEDFIFERVRRVMLPA